MTGPGETAAAAPKGNAEALRQKGRTTTILRRVRPVRTPKVQPAPAGNLSGTKTEAQNCRKRFCRLLCVQNVSGACPSRRRGVSTMRPEGVQRLDKRSKRSKTSGTNDGINVIRRKEHERTQTHPAVRDPCGGRAPPWWISADGKCPSNIPRGSWRNICTPGTSAACSMCPTWGGC